MTPTSGDAPYTFTAEIKNKDSINFVRYGLEYRVSSSTTACPTGSQTSANVPIVANSILSNGFYVQEGNSVPAGTCRTGSLIIRNLTDNSIVDFKNISIDNL